MLAVLLDHGKRDKLWETFPRVPVGHFPSQREAFSMLRAGRCACMGEKVQHVSLCGRLQALQLAVWLLPFMLGGDGPVPREAAAGDS